MLCREMNHSEIQAALINKKDLVLQWANPRNYSKLRGCLLNFNLPKHMENVSRTIGGYEKPFVTRNDMVHFSICDQYTRRHLISSG